jgi:uncharacterized protein YqeY
MGLFEDLQKQYIEARKAQDKFLTNVLSLLISDLKYEKINKQKDLEDADVLAFIQKTIKQKKEVLLEFEKASRTDLINKETKEIEFLSKLLPAMLSEAEIKEIALKIKEGLGALTPSDMGRLMKEVMAAVKGKADGALVKNIVADILK